ncbi:MAG: peptidoglycan-binding protein, partial [Alphaproteobacteria bacterium]
LYERGIGVEKDTVKAYQWYALAARHGDKKAIHRRDAVTVRLSAEQIAKVAQNVANWSSLPVDVSVNGPAPEPPASVWEAVKTVTKPKNPNPEEAHSQDTKKAWSTSITPVNSAVVEVQRMLNQLGFKPGPADGVMGPLTVAAIREFEGKNGFPVTGKVSAILLAELNIMKN